MAASVTDFTTLATVKQWYGNEANDGDDPLLQSLITAMTREIMTYCGRGNLLGQTFNEIRSGTGSNRIMLSNYPVVRINSLALGGVAVNAASYNAAPGVIYGGGYQQGYLLAPWDGNPPGNAQLLSLMGYYFWRGINNIVVNYLAGYIVLGEAWTIPGTPFQVIPLSPNGRVAVDQGVTYANTGVALTPVASAPVQGQYIPPNTTAADPVLGYTFASADEGAAVLLNYSFVPADLEYACYKMVGEAYSYRGRIGTKTKSLGGNESMSYMLNMMPDIKGTLDRYCKVASLV